MAVAQRDYARTRGTRWLAFWQEMRWRFWRFPALSLIYRLYEQRLLAQVQAFPLPRHIGIILDGNRRFARRHNLTDPQEIYNAGAQKLDDLLDWCADLALGAITT